MSTGSGAKVYRIECQTDINTLNMTATFELNGSCVFAMLFGAYSRNIYLCCTGLWPQDPAKNNQKRAQSKQDIQDSNKYIYIYIALKCKCQCPLHVTYIYINLCYVFFMRSHNLMCSFLMIFMLSCQLVS